VLPASSAILRVAFLGASVVAHGVVFVAMGHSTPTATESEREVAVSVGEEAPPSPAELFEAVAAAKPSSFVPRPTHTHSYPVPPDHDMHPHDPSIVHLPFAAARAPVVSQPPPEAHDAPPSQAPARFTLIVGAETAATDSASSAGSATAPYAGTDADPLAESDASSPARLIGTISPAYPPQALAQQVEAIVAVSVVVTATGSVADVQLVKPAGFGFDEAVLDAVRKARFVPAQRDGRAVAVRKRFTVTFALR
jgi:TonB family protein